ncbi:MAG TPA: hypothetical protein VJT50_00155 [Pyrinomonadaceae bacterium]|nr:hypothetical protein [Pyrinomonadaceae bacterium]
MKPIALAFITLLLISTAAVHAQTCVANRNSPPASNWYWAPDSEVKVHFVRGMFTPEQQNMLLSAMEFWTQAAHKAGAGVSFIYAGETGGVINCENCLTVTRRDVYHQDRKHYAFFNPLRQRPDGRLFSAWIDLDFATTGPKALKGFMVHELGHGLGLWDCTTCHNKQTIMNGFPGINKDNGLLEASHCDLEVVRQVYDQRRASSSVVARAGQD